MSLPYTLPRDANESSRLNEQHQFWKTNVGFVLHPRITASLPSNVHIGDVGTGTGVWLLDLASQSPESWQFSGLDMSSTQFPPQQPSNVAFGTLNILEPIPEDYKGQFDVLHLRLLILGLGREDWPVAASNLLTMLKPGGWLHWEEADFQRTQFLQSVPGVSIEAAKRLYTACQELNGRRGRMLDEPRRLVSILANAGFEGMEEDVFSSDRIAETREAYNQASWGAVGGSLRSMIEEKGEADGWTMEDLELVLAQSKSDLSGAKVYYRSDIHVVIARRPT